MQKIYPSYSMTPYITTGGTDARFYKEVTDNALRFAPSGDQQTAICQHSRAG